MNRHFSLLALVVATAVLATTVAAAVEAKAEPQTLCPVMGGKIDKKLYVDHDGKRIYACCAGCLPAIKKDPAGTIKKLEAQGIELEATPKPHHQAPEKKNPGSGHKH